MKLLVIDAGNSRCKYCHGEATDQFPAGTLSTIEYSSQKIEFSELPTSDRCIISSVSSQVTQRLEEALASTSCQTVYLSAENCPIELAIKSPQTLGADRIAAALGAVKHYPKGAIVIDCGTATTVDLITDGNHFIGGCIFPGWQVAFKSLAENANQLPLVNSSFDSNPPFFGDDTNSAIRAGVFWNQVGGVEKIVSNYQLEFGPLPVLVTGGFGKLVLNAASFEGEYREALVLEGLWEFAQNLDW